MKTDDLIAALAADAGHRAAPPGRALAGALVTGSVVCAIAFAATLGPRPDIGTALGTWRFDLKLALLAAAVVIGWIACRRAMRPAGGRGAAKLAGPLLLAIVVALAVELSATPHDTWAVRLVGSNALLCLAAIPSLAVAPLVVVLLAMRTGAPASPARAGAVAGVLAGAVAGLFYGTHCFDDSPLFVAVWYPLAVLLVAFAGALAGSRLLRW